MKPHRQKTRKVPLAFAALWCFMAIFLLWNFKVRSNWFQHSISPIDRSHCRTDLPGCVPKEIKYIYFLHVPKAAGTTVRTYLQSQGNSTTIMSDKFTVTWCNLYPVMPGHLDDRRYNCYPRNSSASLESGCNMAALENQSKDLEAFSSSSSSQSQPFYHSLNCNAASGHYDVNLYNTIPTHMKKNTLLIISLREPISRAISLYYFLHKDRLGQSWTDFSKTIPVVDKMTHMLAGDYCCYKNAPVYETGQDRLQAAVDMIRNNAGVLMLSERMDESMKYLAHVLGWPQLGDQVVTNVNPHRREVDKEANVALEAATYYDRQLYNVSLSQFEKQALHI